MSATAVFAMAAVLIGAVILALVGPTRVAPQSFPWEQPATQADPAAQAAQLNAVMANAAAWEVRAKQQLGYSLTMSPALIKATSEWEGRERQQAALLKATQEWEAREKLTGGGYAPR